MKRSHTLPPRPRSASRPRSAGATRTRSYFDSRDGKAAGNDDSDDAPAPFFRSASNHQTNADDDTRPIFSLLSDLDEDNSFYMTRSLKPQNQFVDDMQFSFAGMRKIIYNCLKGRNECSTQLQLLCEPGKSTLTKCDDDTSADNPTLKAANSLKAQGPIGFLLILCHYIVSPILSCFSDMKQNVESGDGDNEEKQSEEDGLFVSSSKSKPASKPSNLLRLEERIRRELALEIKLPIESNGQTVSGSCINKDGDIPPDNDGAATPEKKPISAKIDESFWMSPGRQLVGPENHAGNVQHDVDLTIQVEEIKFSQHPEFTDEEKALSNVNRLYEQYREHLDAKSFHYTVIRLTEIFQRTRSILAEQNEKSKESSKSTIATMMIPLLEDLKSTSLNLVAESDFIRTNAMQIKRGWNELNATEHNKNSNSADMNIKTDTLIIRELNNDVKQLLKEINSTKRALNQICRKGSCASSRNSLQNLDDVESTLSNIQHFEEEIELVRPSLSEPGWIPKVEKLRQQRITSEKYFARLLVNGIVVGDTKVGQLDWPSYSLKLSHRFNLKLSQKPTDTCIQIWKTSFAFVPDTLICTCYNVIQSDGPAGSDQSNEEPMHDSPSHLMGDWLQFSSSRSDLQQHWKGSVMLLSSCAERVGKYPIPTTRMANIPQQDVFKFRRMKRLIHSPPRAETRYKKSTKVISSFQADGVYPDRQSMMAFKLPDSGILFSNKRLLEEPLRHILIKKRNNNPALVPSPIPSTELMVQNNDRYHALIKDTESNDEMVIVGAIKERDAVRKQHMMDISRGIKQYTQLRETRRRKHRFSEVIQDVGLFRFANDDEFEMPLPARKRSLFPNNVHQLQSVRDQSHARCSLLLTIAGGKNVPMKLEADTLMGEHDQEQEMLISVNDMPRLSETRTQIHSGVDGDEREAYLGVLAKVKFRGKAYLSKVVLGRSMSPQWNETISIPLDMPQESSTTSTSLYKDEFIDIILFDCTNLDMRQMGGGGYYDDEDTTISEARYIGHVCIPLLTVLKGTINGFVPLVCPEIIVGYVKDSNSTDISTADNEENGHHLSIMEPEHHQEAGSIVTMLRIHATTEPLRIVLPQLCLDFPSNEIEAITTRVKQWSQDHLNFNGDHCQVLWPDINGNTFLVSRFLAVQTPPSFGLDSLAGCSHYVSLLEDRDDSLGVEEGMILTGQQIINIKAANLEERAILLMNFFLYLSKKSPAKFGADLFLVVGFAIPEGRTAWVLRRCSNTNDVVFWDATTGRAYPQSDESCPLHKIYYLASPDNIYSNKQCEKKPILLDFDILNPRKWVPLHLDGKPMGKSKMTLMTVQDEALHFTPLDNQYAREVQGEISSSIQDAIRGWRRSTTSFRSDVATKIAHTIEKLEQAKLCGQSMVKTNIPESITKTRKVFGFPLHFPFTSIQDVLTQVEATEIHCNKNPRVEYAVAVRAFPYPGGVISLWVFVCSLVPKS